MRINLTLAQKGLVIVAVPLVFELILCAVLGVLLQQSEHEIVRERHSKAVIAESNALLKNFIDSATCLYLYQHTNQQLFLDRHYEAAKNIPLIIKSLQVSLLDSPNQQESLARLEKFTSKGYALLARVRKLVEESKNPDELTAARSELARSFDDTVKELRDFVKEQEHAEMIDPQKEAHARLLTMQVLLIGVWSNIIIAVGLVAYFNRGTIARLAVLMDNTKRMARGEKLTPTLGGGDEIAELDRVFHEMARTLDETAQRKQELVAMVSHDLRTPLTSVRAALTLLGAGALGAQTDKALSQIGKAESSVGRLIDLINDLLDIEKMEAGKIDLDIVPASLTVNIDRAVEAVEALASDHGIKIEIPTQDYQVLVDRDRLVQVMVNLLSNAIKFSPDNTTIVIATNPVDGFIETRVIDQGRGIPKTHLESVFQRFQQVEKSDAAPTKGTGLGLPICKMIIEAHGGTINVESEPGKGSVFWFRLPKA